MTECPYCGLKLSGAGIPSAPLEECPNCGTRMPVAPEGRSARQIIRQYFADLWTIITRPTEFFQRMPIRGGVGGPLAFALITHWLGESGNFVWRNILGGQFGETLSQGFSIMSGMFGDVADIDSASRQARVGEIRDHVLHWFWGAGTVIIDPFKTLVMILIISCLVYLGVRILVIAGRNGAPRELTYETALRIVCFGMSPAIFAALPFFGTALSWFLTLVVTTIGAREVYRIGTGRALLIALFPNLIFIGIMGTGLVLTVFLFVKFIASAL